MNVVKLIYTVKVELYPRVKLVNGRCTTLAFSGPAPVVSINQVVWA